MSMAWVRKYYRVPAKRGGRVEYTEGKQPRLGTIRSASNGRLNIQLDGEKIAYLFHPTWELRYLEPALSVPVIRNNQHDTERYIREVAVPHQGPECLIWPFFRRSDGYARVRRKYKTVMVHRYVCLLLHGEPPVGKNLAAHSCGNGHLGCVSGAHMTWKSNKENSDDQHIHGTRIIGERNGRAKLTTSDVIKIRSLPKDVLVPSIAKVYGVSSSTISAIIKRKKWTHVP